MSQMDFIQLTDKHHSSWNVNSIAKRYNNTTFLSTNALAYFAPAISDEGKLAPYLTATWILFI